MSLQEAFESAKPIKRSKSEVVALLLSMSKEDREATLAALRQPVSQLGHKMIRTILAKHGYEISVDSIRRFRNGDVSIPPELTGDNE